MSGQLPERLQRANFPFRIPVEHRRDEAASESFAHQAILMTSASVILFEKRPTAGMPRTSSRRALFGPSTIIGPARSGGRHAHARESLPTIIPKQLQPALEVLHRIRRADSDAAPAATQFLRTSKHGNLLLRRPIDFQSFAQPCDEQGRQPHDAGSNARDK